MSLASDWDSAVPIGNKPGGDLASQWDAAKPVKLPKAAAPAAEKPKLDVPSSNIALGEGALAMGSGMIAKPVSEIAGMAAVGREMFSPTPGGGDPAGFRDDVRKRMTYEPRTQQGENMAQYNPLALLAKALGWAGGKAGGMVDRMPVPPGMVPMREGAARGVEEAVPQLASLLGAKAGGPVADATAGAMKGTAKGVMQSALKPPLEALRTGKADAALDTLLKEGINVSEGGAAKLKARVADLNDRISKVIENSPATIDKQHVGYRLQEKLDQFQKQVSPLEDIRAIQKAWDEFLDHPLLSDKIPVKTAQEMKQGTYKSLGDKSYGELKGADIEAQKTLARGLKEEIAKAVPEVRALNAEESKMLNALSLVERRALMEANKNPAGLGWLTTNPGKFAAWMADRSGAFKSIVARMLYSSADVLPPLGAAAAPAAAVTQGQLPPPPQ